MDITTRNFFRLLRAGAFNQEESIEPISAWKWKRIYQLSLMHGVSAVMYDGLKRCDSQFFVQLPDGLQEEWEKTTREIEKKSRQADERLLQLLAEFNQYQLRPLLFKGQGIAAYYDRPDHRLFSEISIYFPFATQGHKADEWAEANGTSVQRSSSSVHYLWGNLPTVHYHRMLRLTNKLLDHSLQNIIETDIRESSPTYIQINGTRIETVSYNLMLLLLLLRITCQMLNDGILLKHIVDLAVFLRKAGDKVDYVKVQSWIEKLRLSRMAKVSGALLVQLLGFSADELPFTMVEADTSIARIMDELFLLRQAKKGDWYFQQGKDIFVHAANTSAMFWQVRHSARYFRYYPSESFTNLFAAFTHSLSHIEE